jgi:hypothetical protein
VLLLSLLPAGVRAQLTFTTNNGAITVTGYSGVPIAVTIPVSTHGLPVTAIGAGAFENCESMASLSIPSSVTTIGEGAFHECSKLTSLTIPNSVVSIGDGAFEFSALTSVAIPNSVTNLGEGAFSGCGSLSNVTIGTNVTSVASFGGCPSLISVTIPNSVTSIGYGAFQGDRSLASITIPDSVTNLGVGALGATSLTNVTIPGSVTSVGDDAFADCGSLTSAHFQGNAPSFSSFAFLNDKKVTVYYLPGTTGWDEVSTNIGVPVVLWLPQVQTGNASFGVRTNQFGFTINWASGTSVAVDARTSLANPTWTPLVTNTLTTGSLYFSDLQWTNYPARFYRLRWP